MVGRLAPQDVQRVLVRRRLRCAVLPGADGLHLHGLQTVRAQRRQQHRV